MGALIVIPRLQQLTQFTEALRLDAEADRHALFRSRTTLTESEVDDLLYNGLCSLESSVEEWENALTDMASLGIESCVGDTLVNLQSRYPAGRDLSVAVYPMDADDAFGREKLGGVSGWTNWEGTTISLVVYPGAAALPRLTATVVHEYHHHYRTMVLNNGHDRIPLLESLIREGLAEHFVAEVLGDCARGPYAAALSGGEARSLWTTVYHDRMFLQDADNTNAYQFGGTSGLPLWAGYAMGYHLVAWYRELHPELSVSQLTRLDAERFVPTSDQH